MASDFTDCRSVAGVTVGLIDAMIAIARVLAMRDLSGDAAIGEALRDLRADADMRLIMREEVMLDNKTE